MSTIFDYVSVLGFVILVGLYVHYNSKEDQDFTGYLWPSIGLAITNYFGNEGYPTAAFVFCAISILYTYIFIIQKKGIPDKDDDE